MSTVPSASGPKPVFVVAGVGSGGGTGGATARLFAKSGYSIALIARDARALDKFAQELSSSGVEAVSFPVASYSPTHIATAFSAISARFPNPKYSLRVALFNAASRTVGPFLSITPEQVRESLETNVEGSFAFSHHVLTRFKNNDIVNGKRGTLLFQGATASVRGNTTTSAFAAGRFGVRALSQSLAKEFGKQNIHVAHVIVDGMIATERMVQVFSGSDPTWAENEDVRLNPDGIAKSYLYLVDQDRSAWTWELDLRPAHEKW